MKNDDKEKMIQSVVAEVLKALEGRKQSAAADEGIDKMLVIGPPEKIPGDLKESYRIFEIDDYEQNENIYRYQKVLITELSMTALADTALGRAGDPASSALIHALLAGIDVAATKDAIPHRKYAGQGSTRLYALLENYVNVLQTYGVHLISEKREVIVKEVRPAKFEQKAPSVPQGSARPNADRLITEDKALVLISECDGTIYLSKNAVVTPSAWDIFERQKIKVIRQ